MDEVDNSTPQVKIATSVKQTVVAAAWIQSCPAVLSCWVGRGSSAASVYLCPSEISLKPIGHNANIQVCAALSSAIASVTWHSGKQYWSIKNAANVLGFFSAYLSSCEGDLKVH